ncbi:Hypothetical predicted protein [Marmota monax]|uniref:Uncharacterized protein n=1 Tax=Marmota monax TaxID=9995 RepID=A0A5E4CHV1_MARMO|nr:Hypothetical predicted protein [Marmota monax]
MKAAGEPTPDLGQTLEWLRRELVRLCVTFPLTPAPHIFKVSRPSSQVPHWTGQRLQASLWGPATRCMIAVSGQEGVAGASRGDCSFSHPQALGLPGSPRVSAYVRLLGAGTQSACFLHRTKARESPRSKPLSPQGAKR